MILHINSYRNNNKNKFINKKMKFTFVNIIIVNLFILSFTQNKNIIEEIQTPKNIDTLKEILPSLFEKYTNIFFGSQCTYSDKLTYNYFRKIESSTKIVYFLDRKENDIPSIIKEILTFLDIKDKNYKNLYKFIESFIDQLKEEDYTDLEWLNQIIASTAKKNGEIVYGNILAIKKGNKIDIILCYGSIELNSISFGEGYLDYSEFSNINKGYIEETHVSYINTYGIDRGDKVFMTFLRLAGYKALGNIYAIDIPYPRFKGFF